MTIEPGSRVERENPDEAAAPRPVVKIFDRHLIEKALGDDGYRGPEDERPWGAGSDNEPENAIWVREMRKILASPLGETRSLLVGTRAMAARLAAATRTMPHFRAATGILRRAIGLSAATGRPVAPPAILLLAKPGVGKTRFMNAVAGALETPFVPIAMNATSDRFQLGGLSPFWKYAKMGKLARALIESPTASPLFCLDELDKASTFGNDNVVDVLLSVLERESARSFTDEYVGVPLDLSWSLFVASANSTAPIPAPVLSRFLVLEIPDPTPAQARALVRSIADEVIDRCAAPALTGISERAVAALAGLTAREARMLVEIASAHAVCAGRARIGVADVEKALGLTRSGVRAPMGFLR